jgi:hypothetical protein
MHTAGARYAIHAMNPGSEPVPRSWPRGAWGGQCRAGPITWVLGAAVVLPRPAPRSTETCTSFSGPITWVLGAAVVLRRPAPHSPETCTSFSGPITWVLGAAVVLRRHAPVASRGKRSLRDFNNCLLGAGVARIRVVRSSPGFGGSSHPSQREWLREDDVEIRVVGVSKCGLGRCEKYRRPSGRIREGSKAGPGRVRAGCGVTGLGRAGMGTRIGPVGQGSNLGVQRGLPK